jgi:hypothetical protein
MNTEVVSKFTDTAAIVMLACMAMVPSIWLLLALRMLVTGPLNTIIGLAKRGSSGICERSKK